MGFCTLTFCFFFVSESFQLSFELCLFGTPNLRIEICCCVRMNEGKNDSTVLINRVASGVATAAMLGFF